MTDPITYGIVGAAIAAVGTVLGAAAKAWVDGKRVDQVEGPRTTNEAWRVIFDTMQEQISSLGRRIASVEHDLQSAHDTIAERDRTIAERDSTIEHGNATIRKLRSYVSVITALLSRHHIPYPDPPADDGTAPERREPMPVTVTLTTEQDHHS